LFDQSAKLRVVVEDHKVVVHEFDERVVAGNGDVRDPNFALVSSSKFDPGRGYVSDHDETFGLVADPLQYHVVVFWFLNYK
jgi:hypothetical protein